MVNAKRGGEDRKSVRQEPVCRSRLAYSVVAAVPGPPYSGRQQNLSALLIQIHRYFSAPMSSQIDSANDVSLLSNKLDHLQTHDYVPRSPASREGYGFRSSGVTTPQKATIEQSTSTTELVPDPNGLGWPAKSTVSRLNATPEEKAEREKRMAVAIRTILDCIGEDPDREGLLRTPERYTQALLFMTKGYEERLAGS